MISPCRLQNLLSGETLPAAIAGLEVTGITLDSRAVKAGDLFVAVQGLVLDGKQFIESAAAKGAVAVLIEAEAQSDHLAVGLEHGLPVIKIYQLASGLSDIAATVYQDPSEQMNLIGVTGTNGKTTCVNLLANLAQLLGRSSASMGTMGVVMGQQVLHDYAMTTPDAITCQAALAQLSELGVSTVAVEVSSHGLAQNRVQGLKFKAAIFTNLSHDHLDFHKTVKRYAEAKRQLFSCPSIRFAIINTDDSYADFMSRGVSSQAKIISFSLKNSQADVFASDISYLQNETHFTVRSPWGTATVRSALLGAFNVYNLVAVIATLCAQGASFEQTVLQCSKLQAIAGRMQVLKESGDITVVVDYAHTPDALKNVLGAVQDHSSGGIWCVFGCGGDRDKAKRPLMASIAESMANYVIVTSDNPRQESPVGIIEDICEGFLQPIFAVESSREVAIQTAIGRAKAGDVVVIAGKGHEKYQIIGTEQLPFDDVAVAQLALQERSRARGKGGAASCS